MDNHGSTQGSDAEFVITAPAPYGPKLAYKIRARMTLGVITQLIAQSEKYIIISSPFIQRANSNESKTLREALISALSRGIDISIVSTGSGLESLNLTDDNERPNLHYFQPKANIEDNKRLGSHAKFCLADSEHAYIGSANLTIPGLSENLEMGLLIHGKIAKQVEDFWEMMLEIGFFIEVVKPKPSCGSLNPLFY